MRIFCVDCPEECKTNAQTSSTPCLQSMWNDGVCDVECNNLACGHNDCTTAQVIDKCVAEQDLAGDLADPPGSSIDSLAAAALVPMNLQVDFAAARLEIRPEINEMVLTQEVEFSLQWQDSRLRGSPCAAVLSSLLSLSPEEANSDIGRNMRTAYWDRFWIPNPDALDPIPSYYAWVEEGAFSYEESGSWTEGLAPDDASRRRSLAGGEGADGDSSGIGIAAEKAAKAERVRRRAAAEARQVARVEASLGDRRTRAESAKWREGASAASKAWTRSEAHRLARLARRKARAKHGSAAEWRAAERRRLSEEEGDADAAVTEVPCADCVTWAGVIEFQIIEGFRYDDFPFDKQVVQTSVHVKGADLFTCREQDAFLAMGLTSENAESKLLPATGTWLLDGSLADALTLEHPIDSVSGEEDRETCTVKIHIRRNWNVFFTKQICTMLLVTAGGLMALLMHHGELIGDRCAQLLVAVLIIITALQIDLGLGNLSYLIWVDFFNLMQLLVLLTALMQTMVIHRLAYRKQTVTVIVFDRVFRFLIPCCLYPSLVLGMFFLGNKDLGLAYFFLIGGSLGTAVLGAYLVHRLYFRAIHNREKAIETARTISADDPGYDKMLDALFHNYDLDGGGELDNHEMRVLLESLFKGEPRAAISAAMQEVAKISGSDEEVNEHAFRDAFDAAIAAVSEYKLEHAADGGGPPKPKISYASSVDRIHAFDAGLLKTHQAKSSENEIAVAVEMSSSFNRRHKIKQEQQEPRE